MTITLVPHEQQRAQVLNRAASATLAANATSLLAEELVLQSRLLRGGAGSSPRFFVLHGSVEDHRVRASWFRGRLLASRELLRRAEMLVDLRERFVSEPDGPVMEAGLEDPAAALLTLVRSCDRVGLVKLGPLSGGGLEVYRGTPHRAPGGGVLR
ncbi:MAG TPA: hypothetical protein DCQ30_13325 [Acidimicrobiaceae bacterium]|nr:hypothetical protein [Acidimicrobiaceae bacterium]